jgi:hypothetical protein
VLCLNVKQKLLRISNFIFLNDVPDPNRSPFINMTTILNLDTSRGFSENMQAAL